MTKLVFSYSHVDEDLRNELEKHLSPLKRTGLITTWHDRRIVPGQDFESEIDQNFEQADIVLLLVSHDFIASDYCYEVEMTRALQRHENGEAVVIPVILKVCAWHTLPFGKILAATPDGKAVTKYADINEGFVHVVDAVSKALDKLRPPQQPSVQSPKVAGALHNFQPGPRSSNMAIKKKFTDRDRDLTCRQGFDYLSKFFENSLNELSARYDELEIDFKLRDRDSFECSVYKEGKRVSLGGFWRAAGGIPLGDICYRQGGISTNSCNESMSVADNGNILGFKPLMGSFTGHSQDQLLTEEGMAEYFWDSFIRPLK